MALIGFTSVHGAPGASTLALAVAHHWPVTADRPAILVEADGDGGVLAARHGLSLQPGLTELAGAARVGIDAGELGRYMQTMTSGVPVIVAHPAAEQTSAALRTAASHLATALVAHPDCDTIVDLGRLRPGTPATALANACETLIVVVRCVAEELVTVLSRLSALERIAPVELALVGQSPYPADEVRRASGIETIHLIPTDPAAVRNDPAAAKGKRSPWTRAVRSLTEHLVAGVIAERDLNARVDGVPMDVTGWSSAHRSPIGAVA